MNRCCGIHQCGRRWCSRAICHLAGSRSVRASWDLTWSMWAQTGKGLEQRRRRERCMQRVAVAALASAWLAVQRGAVAALAVAVCVRLVVVDTDPTHVASGVPPIQVCLFGGQQAVRSERDCAVCRAASSDVHVLPYNRLPRTDFSPASESGGGRGGSMGGTCAIGWGLRKSLIIWP